MSDDRRQTATEALSVELPVCPIKDCRRVGKIPAGHFGGKEYCSGPIENSHKKVRMKRRTFGGRGGAVVSCPAWCRCVGCEANDRAMEEEALAGIPLQEAVDPVDLTPFLDPSSPHYQSGYPPSIYQRSNPFYD